MRWRIPTMTAPATPPTSPAPAPTPDASSNRGREMEDLPWTGITVMIAVMSLLLFMAVPMTGPTEAERQTAHLERECFVALEEIQRAIQDYQGDHGTWPGQTGASIRSLTPPVFDSYALAQQLQLNTDLAGTVMPSGGESHPFGPYLPNGIPANPQNGSSAIHVVGADAPLQPRDAHRYGWTYNPTSGEIQAIELRSTRRR